MKRKKAEEYETLFEFDYDGVHVVVAKSEKVRPDYRWRATLTGEIDTTRLGWDLGHLMGDIGYTLDEHIDQKQAEKTLLKWVAGESDDAGSETQLVDGVDVVRLRDNGDYIQASNGYSFGDAEAEDLYRRLVKWRRRSTGLPIPSYEGHPASKVDGLGKRLPASMVRFGCTMVLWEDILRVGKGRGWDEPVKVPRDKKAAEKMAAKPRRARA